MVGTDGMGERGALEWLKNKNIVSVYWVHHTQLPNMFAAVTLCSRLAEKKIQEEGAQHGLRLHKRRRI